MTFLLAEASAEENSFEKLVHGKFHSQKCVECEETPIAQVGQHRPPRGLAALKCPKELGNHDAFSFSPPPCAHVFRDSDEVSDLKYLFNARACLVFCSGPIDFRQNNISEGFRVGNENRKRC